jgi:hypothetical protein
MTDQPIELFDPPKRNGKAPNGADLFRTAAHAPQPAPAHNAAAEALIANLLQDLATLKAQMNLQIAVNDVTRDRSDGHQTILEGHQTALKNISEFITAHNEGLAAEQVRHGAAEQLIAQAGEIIGKFNKLIDAVAEIGDRLHALDGKRSITRDDLAPAANDAGEHAP